jgi:hypothetical protein
LDRATGFPLKVFFYLNSKDRAQNRPYSAWIADSFDRSATITCP